MLDNTSYLCVQSKLGYEALREGMFLFSIIHVRCIALLVCDAVILLSGSDVVLGHVTSGHGTIPPEQKIIRLKHSPGSGVLSVSVVSDGPTRILKITDENKKVPLSPVSYTHLTLPTIYSV